jgi:hypothetical protein
MNIELNHNEIERIAIILNDYINDIDSGLIELDREFVMDDKTFVTLFVEGTISKDQSFRKGQMNERVEFECETFIVYKDDVEHPQECELLSFSDEDTYFDMGNGHYM